MRQSKDVRREIRRKLNKKECLNLQLHLTTKALLGYTDPTGDTAVRNLQASN